MMEEKRPWALLEEVYAAPRKKFAFLQGLFPALKFPSDSVAWRLWQAKWLLFSCTVLSGLAALVLGSVQIPLYRLQTSVEILNPADAEPDAEANDENSSRVRDWFVDTQMRVIQSRTLMERALERLTDRDRSALTFPPRYWWSHPTYEESMQSLRQRISAAVGTNLKSIEITMLSPDPVAGARLLNAFTRELQDFNIERAWRKTRRSRLWTEKHLEELKQRSQESNQAFAEFSRRGRRSRANAARLKTLKMNADSDRQIYESTAAFIHESTTASLSKMGNVRVVQQAFPVQETETPSDMLKAELGIAAGLIIGVATVMLGSLVSNTFSEPAALSEYLNLEVLAAIPPDFLARAMSGIRLPARDPSLELSIATNTKVADAYVQLRSKILHHVCQRFGPRKLVFTSTEGAEGKTAVVANLGAALASAKQRVLLIDGDLRNPGLHSVFAASNETGLAELLLNTKPGILPLNYKRVIRRTQIPFLYLLTTGKTQMSSAEIVSSVKLPKLLRELSNQFDVILIDSPPLLPFADTRSLARAADAAVLVVKAGVTKREAAVQAQDTLVLDGTPILGSILTDCEVS